MAEVTAMRNNALPYPVYGLTWNIVFPFLDADGDLVSAATTPDAEVSLNGNTFADCTNESTEIATNSGIYYLTLTAAEMTADIVTVQAKSATSGMKTTVATLYPRKLVSMRSGTTQGGSSTTIQFDSSASAVDDYYNGMVVSASLDGTTEVRMITDYTGSTKTATVHVAWISGDPGPDSNDTFVIYRPDGVQIGQSDVTALLGTAWLTPAVAGTPDVNAKQVGGQTASAAGTVTFPGTIASTTNITTAAGCAVSSIGTDVINSTALAASAVTEIQSGLALASSILTGAQTATAIWTDTTAGDFTTALSIGKSIMNGVSLGTGLTINAYTGNTPQTGDSFARIGLAGVGLTNLGDTRIANLDATVSSRLATSGYTAPLDAAGTRTAVGLGSANLDTQLDALPTNGELATALAGADDATLAAIAALNNITAASVWAVGTRTLTGLGFSLASSDFGTDWLTSTGLAASAVSEIQSGLSTISASDVWAAGSRTLTAGTNIQLPSDGLANISAWSVNLTGSLSGSVGSVAGDVGGNVAGNILGTIAELTTTTRALPGQVTPSATPTLADAIMQLFQSDTNPRDQTSSLQRIYNRAGDTVHQKRSAADSGSTASLGAVVSGP